MNKSMDNILYILKLKQAFTRLIQFSLFIWPYLWNIIKVTTVE